MGLKKLYRFETFTLNASDRLLWLDGEPVPLALKVIDTLIALVENPGRVVSKDELIRLVWQDTAVEEIGLARNISLLRRALGDTRESKRIIETLPKRGYRFNPPVEMVAPLPETFAAAGSRAVSGELPNNPKRTFALATTILAFVLGAGAGAYMLRPRPEPRITGFRKLTDGRRAKLSPYCCRAPVSNGSFVYYVQDVNGIEHLVRTSLRSGETQLLRDTPAGLFAASIAPELHALLTLDEQALFGRSSPVYHLPLEGGSPEPIAGLRGHDVAASADSTRLAWADGSNLFVSDAKGENIRRLAATKGIPTFLRWSPNGRVIRFSLWLPEEISVGLWEISAEGQNLRQLPLRSRENRVFCCGSWVAGGRYYVFESFATPWSPESDLWIARDADLRGSSSAEPLQLSHGPLKFSHPAPSADGQSVYAIGEEPHIELVSFDMASRRLQPFVPNLKAEGLTYSLDGSKIAYCPYSDHALWIAQADGTNPRRLTGPDFYVRFPRWSPDGKRIAFLAGRAHKTWKVFVISENGGEPREVLPSDSREGVPTWAPDGQSLYFGRLLDGLDLNDFAQPIYRVDLKAGRTSIVPGTQNLWTPRISPDGKTLAAFSSDSRRLVLVDLRNGSSQTVYQTRDLNEAIWSSDGNWLWFDSVDPAHLKFCG